ncbi:hypothetical protein [Microbacterium sp. Marseille-Q6965]|uniref:hypothetical protein n=1 Tax=Microbacterium sp. Marseille-Q6965 TaxID=2965072 RepID=UPI0021B7FCB3|nr:hypothetical protein [Microbacterium sp. Marseille-Q6965]
MTDPTAPARPVRTSAPMSSGHPALGRAPEATIVPVGLDCYQILLDDAVQGYVCATEDGWECLAGSHLGETRPLGARSSITAAIRDLCREGAAAPVA